MMAHASFPVENRLQGRIAIVTGGSGGIGAAICRALAGEGAHVIVGYNSSREAAERVVASLAGEKHMAAYAPVAESSALSELSARIAAIYGRTDIIVNSAGTTRFVPHGDLDGLDDELISKILNVNVGGVIATTRAFRAMLAASPDGLIINISSIAAVTAMGSNIAYCASKAAVDNLTKSLARALAPSIRVLSISPGLVDTEFVRGLDVDWRNEQAEKTALKRLAAPEEVAQAVLAAALYMPFTTGSIIPVDGGRQLA